MLRDAERCPHRGPAEEGGGATAECGLLARLSGVADRTLCRVAREACAACCAGSEPSEQEFNPSFASLVYDLAGRVAVLGGVPGCDLARAAALRDRAEQSLYLGAEEERPLSGTTRPRPRRRAGGPARVGLVGWNTPSGLGSLNRALARHLPAERWLVPPHPYLRTLPLDVPYPVSTGTAPGQVRRFLRGLDWLIFCEAPPLPSLVATARALGVRTACVPMWEHLDECAAWLRAVDLMLCPTRLSHAWLASRRERLGLRCALEFFPWPIDVDRFAFRPRSVCRTFLFVHGTGGLRADGQPGPAWDGRKGLSIVAEAARRAPSVKILVRTQRTDLPGLPPNVEVRAAQLDDSPALYDEGDVCIQPSRWEGLGLPLLECQARGLPLVTTDAPPMNEHNPLAVLAASAAPARLCGSHATTVHEADPNDLARVLRHLHGTDISAASRAARRFVETEHSWTTAARVLRRRLLAAIEGP